MWTRKQLKERARNSFYRNRWRTVLVSLVTVLYLGALGYAESTVISANLTNSLQAISGDSSASSSEPYDKPDGKPEINSDESRNEAPKTENEESIMPDAGNPDVGDASGPNDSGMGGEPGLDDSEISGSFDADSFDADADFDVNGFDAGGEHGAKDSGVISGTNATNDRISERDIVSSVNSPSHAMAFSVVIILLAALGVMVIAALGLALIALIVNPLLVGCRRFFFINLNTPARVGELGYGFDTNYGNIVRVMLHKTIYTILWSCLFVVPGLVKNYEYMMVPYILAEEPDIDRKRAFAISKEMMHGNKWKAFLLDLSFIPWNLLSSITLGIVNIFYVGPYKNMTYAAFYEQMRSNYTQKRMAYTQPEQNTQRPGQEDVQQQGRTAQRPGQNAQPGQDAQRQGRTAQQSGQNVQQDAMRSEYNRQQDGGTRREGMGE